MYTLEFDNVSKRYGREVVVDDHPRTQRPNHLRILADGAGAHPGGLR